MKGKTAQRLRGIGIALVVFTLVVGTVGIVKPGHLQPNETSNIVKPGH